MKRWTPRRRNRSFRHFLSCAQNYDYKPPKINRRSTVLSDGSFESRLALQLKTCQVTQNLPKNETRLGWSFASNDCQKTLNVHLICDILYWSQDIQLTLIKATRFPGLHCCEKKKKHEILFFFAKCSAETPSKESSKKSLTAPLGLSDQWELVNEWFKPTRILARLTRAKIVGKHDFSYFFCKVFR